MRISDWSSDVCSSDLDGPSGGDHADEQADPDQHLETEGDETHPLSANARQQRAERDADGRDHDHERLVARIRDDHCDEAKGIDRPGKPVIGIEAEIGRAHVCQSQMRIPYAGVDLKKKTEENTAELTEQIRNPNS